MTFDVKEGHLDATMVAEVMGKLIQFVERVPSSDSSESICSTLCVHNRVVVCDKCYARSVWDPLAQQLSECEACRSRLRMGGVARVENASASRSVGRIETDVFELVVLPPLLVSESGVLCAIVRDGSPTRVRRIGKNDEIVVLLVVSWAANIRNGPPVILVELQTYLV